MSVTSTQIKQQAEEIVALVEARQTEIDKLGSGACYDLADRLRSDKRRIELAIEQGASKVSVEEQMKASTTVKDLKVLIAEFGNAQNKHIKFGACDTEPDGVFQGLIHAAMDHNSMPVIPRTISGWQLFSGMNGAAKAASELASITRRVCRYIINNNYDRLVRQYVEDYCWRC